MPMHEIAIPMLVFVSVVCLGGAGLVAWSSRDRRIAERLHAGTGGEGTVTVGEMPLRDRALEGVGALGEWVTGSKGNSSLREQLARAGYHHATASAVYLGVKMLLLVGGFLAAAIALWPVKLDMSTRWLAAAAAGAALSFLPNLFIAQRRQARLQDIHNHLPDALDLLEICVSSGMGLDMAWNAVTDEIRRVSTILADEMALSSLEMHLGASRETALRHMAKRTGEENLSSLVAILVQSERFGTSVADALRTFASSLREERSQRAQETAEKMAVKLILPMVLFIFPAVFVVLVGPAGIMLAKLLGG